MKLFGDFEVVRFPEENLIFVTHCILRRPTAAGAVTNGS